MISAKEKKYIKSLQIKKYRQLHQAFLVEGWKSVQEVLQSDWEIEYLFVTAKYADACDGRVIKEADLQSISNLHTNTEALAVVKMGSIAPSKKVSDKVAFLFDGLQDPGNLGTIVRTADWLGLTSIYCTEESVDFYNPKTISASKGSFIRVQPRYVSAAEWIAEQRFKKVLIADMDGKDYRELPLDAGTLIVFGNESLGVSAAVRSLASGAISIPKVGGAESLNVAVSFAIIASRC